LGFVEGIVMKKPENNRQFNVGDKIRVNLHHGKIEDSTIRAVISEEDGVKLQIDFGYEQTALIPVSQVVQD
jgi:small-conductance mechanosensitive channel